jgi:hypothetical protein
MNERIQELMRQSMVEHQFDLRFSPEKFAELIVRDIAAVLRESAEHQSVTGSESEAYILRSHASGIELRYGVE